MTTRLTQALIANRAAPRSGALGSALGTDSSMIATNNRCTTASCRWLTAHAATTDKTASNSRSSTKPRTMNSNHGRRPIHSWLQHQLPQSSSPSLLLTPTAQSRPPIQRQQRRHVSTCMKDEYGEMNDEGHTYVHSSPFLLENGAVLPHAQLRYQTYGTLNQDTRDNVIVICHALTGNASLHSWWGDLLGPGKAFDTDRYLVVCCNILGSCYGSTGPRSINTDTGEPYGMDFPDVSVQDTVRLQLEMLVQELKVHSIHTVIGGSFGGMQAVEFAVQAGSSFNSPMTDSYYYSPADPTTPLVRTVIPIACGAAHTAWQIGISETQRQAIYADPNWPGLEATKGLAVARQIGMISYRTARGYRNKFGRDLQQQPNKDADTTRPPSNYGSQAPWKVKSYLEYQGMKFLDRFDPITYVKMTEQMDSHDVTRGRGTSFADVLQHVEIPAMVLGIDSDVLYPLEEQEELARHLPNGELKIIHSDDGHDGFLLEQEQVASRIVEFLELHK